MSKTVRCPSTDCWPSFDMGQLACDGYFRCLHCGTVANRAEFLSWLNELDEDLARWRADIVQLRTQVTT